MTFDKHAFPYFHKKVLLAIDIGSNAMRSTFVSVENGSYQVLKYKRYPVRLGEDAFQISMIAEKKQELLYEAFREIERDIEIFHPRKVLTVATSAMRNAQNGKEICRTIKNRFNLDVKIIDGYKEAEYIYLAISKEISLKKKTAVLMDIGGGSTELILCQDNIIIDMQSFPLGTVRMLEYFQEGEDLEEFLDGHLDSIYDFIEAYYQPGQIDFMVGTGGNLRRIGKLNVLVNESKDNQLASVKEVKKIYKTIEPLDMKQRITQYQMREDRADVIIPALYITKEILKRFEIPCIQLPRVGLKDGLISAMLG